MEEGKLSRKEDQHGLTVASEEERALQKRVMRWSESLSALSEKTVVSENRIRVEMKYPVDIMIEKKASMIMRGVKRVTPIRERFCLVSQATSMVVDLDSMSMDIMKVQGQKKVFLKHIKKIANI